MNVPPQILMKRLAHGADLQLPSYQSAGSAGFDLVAANLENSPIRLEPGARLAIPTGIAMQIPGGFEGQIRPRSGLALKKGLSVVNAPGTIDSDYRGEILVALINLGSEPQFIHRGDRIAQMVISTVVQVKIVEAEDLSQTTRESGGFGSTGISS